MRTIALYLAFSFFFVLSASSQGIWGHSTIDIDPSTSTVTATCSTGVDTIAEGAYSADVYCTVTDENGDVIDSEEGSDDGTGYAESTITFTGTPGETYYVTGSHTAMAYLDYGEYYDEPILRGWADDPFNFSSFAENPGNYPDYFSLEGPGPEQQIRRRVLLTAITHASGTAPQIPSSLQVLNVTVLPTGTTNNSGCTPSADYGIMVDVKYQVLDQAQHPLKKAGMTPYESDQFAGGGTIIFQPIGPSRNSNSSATTASDGTFHDVPLGDCVTGAFSSANQLQIIYIDSTSQKGRQNSFVYSSSGTGHGTIDNSNDISASR